ncbi:MAG: hypothetical protein VB130_16100 [Clostridium sp.]|nr:hypothetical protein [Clostridium sp.]
MSLKDSLEIYNTDRDEDHKLLEIICINVSRSYCPDSLNRFLINKIINAFNDLEYIFTSFESKNENFLDNIKKYILGCQLDMNRIKEIQAIMKEWALYFPEIGIEPTIKQVLICRYRKEYITNFKNIKKKSYYSLVYIEYLLLVKKIRFSNKERQVQILEKLRNKNKNMLEGFLNCLLEPTNGNMIKNQVLVISEEYTRKLKDEKFLLKVIKEIFQENFNGYGYSNYEDDLKKIYLIQKDAEYWIDIEKLNNLIENQSLKLLKDFGLIDEIKEENRHIIQLTEIALSISNNCFTKKWTSDEYLMEYEDNVIVPFDANPLIISDYLFNEDYDLQEEDFLFVFTRKIKA